MANGLFSAIGAVYKALRARLTREGIHVGSTADYPRVEIHSIVESAWMDKGHTLKSISCIVECISARRMQDVMDMSEENLSRISLILEAMAVYSHVDVLPYYFETILCLQGAKDERTRDMLNLIHDSAKIDFAQFANFGNIGSISPEILRNRGTYGTTLATGVTKIRSAVMEKLEDWYALDDMVD
jgi:hypothetical protein